ncbi:MAG: type II secretion system protein M [Sphingomonas sp.]|uniref:type II secretion system protein M n=1 Tax=Sphingomonas sp. TaxID=28214 RepID=UPI0025CD660E|nr:type II secretion system protein M [Sphingomonas sp.]MBX3564088.1 type II secretion system protein M [Sphingomonas sp.]
MKVILARMPALDAALIRFDTWWSGLSRRERILVGSLGTLLAVLVLTYGVIKPLQSARADALADIRTYETLNARTLAAGTLSRAPTPRRQGAPLEIASTSAAALGLAATPEATSGGVRVTVADANYDNLMAWLADLVATSDLRATRVAIQRGKAPGRVSAVVDLAP